MKTLGLAHPLTFVLWRAREADVGADPAEMREIDGVDALATILGPGPRTFPNASWVVVSDDGNHRCQTRPVTWRRIAHVDAEPSGWCFAYQGALDADAGDLVALLLREEPPDLAVIVAPASSTWESQFVHLIGQPPAGGENRTFPAASVTEAAYVAVQEMLNVVGWSMMPA